MKHEYFNCCYSLAPNFANTRPIVGTGCVSRLIVETQGNSDEIPV